MWLKAVIEPGIYFQAGLKLSIALRRLLSDTISTGLGSISASMSSAYSAAWFSKLPGK